MPTIQNAMRIVYVANQRLIGLSERARHTKTAKAVKMPERATSGVCANTEAVSLGLRAPSLRGSRRGYEYELTPGGCGLAAQR